MNRLPKIAKILISAALIIIVILLLLPGNKTVTLANGASLEWTHCWFKNPANRKVRCGWYRPKQTSDIKIKIPVVYIHHRYKTQPDPVLYINGGPGYSTGLDKKRIRRWLSWVDQTGWKRDVVFWDHRGTGMATPLPECEGLQSNTLQSLTKNESARQEAISWFTFMKNCHKKISSKKYPMDTFSTDNSVKDSLNIMKLVGAKRWKIYAASYGTRVALQLMRQNPEFIDAIVLDSVYPSRIHDLEVIPYFINRAFDNLFKACGLHYFCYKQLPSIKKSLRSLVTQLNKDPQTFHIKISSQPRPVKIVLNGNRLVWAMHGAMYDWSMIEKLPAFMLYAKNKQWTKLKPLVRDYVTRVLDPTFSPIAYYSTECRDRDRALTQQEYNRELNKYPLVKPHVQDMWEFDICKFWTAGRAKKESFTPVKSNIPTLIMNGKLDPATPWQWANEVNKSLINSYFFAIQGVGHGAVDGDQCAANLAKLFLNKPNQRPSLPCQKHWHRPYFKLPKSEKKAPINPES